MYSARRGAGTCDGGGRGEVLSPPRGALLPREGGEGGGGEVEAGIVM